MNINIMIFRCYYSFYFNILISQVIFILIDLCLFTLDRNSFLILSLLLMTEDPKYVYKNQLSKTCSDNQIGVVNYCTRRRKESCYMFIRNTVSSLLKKFPFCLLYLHLKYSFLIHYLKNFLSFIILSKLLTEVSS